MRYDARVASEIKQLLDVELEVLRRRWSELYGSAPVAWISRDVLTRAIAYRLQEEACGGISKTMRRRLVQLAAEVGASGMVQSVPSAKFKPGSKLIREWQGRVHEVLVCDDGYIYVGKLYRSLSQIARLITGTRWSGPRFFGLEREHSDAGSMNRKLGGQRSGRIAGAAQNE